MLLEFVTLEFALMEFVTLEFGIYSLGICPLYVLLHSLNDNGRTFVETLQDGR